MKISITIPGRFKFASMSPGGMIYCILYTYIPKGMEEPPSININQFYLCSDDTSARSSIQWVTLSQPCSQGHVSWCCGDPTPSESSATQSKWWKDTCHDLALRHVHAYLQHDLFSLSYSSGCFVLVVQRLLQWGGTFGSVSKHWKYAPT